MAEKKKRLGLLVPAENTTMEEEFAQWTPDSVVVHTMRMYCPPEGWSSLAEVLKVMNEHLEESARLLALASPEVIAYGCTSGSFLKGLGWEQELIRRIKQASGGIPTVVTARAVLDAFRFLGVKKIAACSPYSSDINRCLLEFLSSAGLEVVSFLSEEGRLEPEVAYRLGKAIDRPEAEAIFISCTAFPTAPIIDRLERELGKPVVTSNQATLWACLQQFSLKEPLAAGGLLLCHPDLTQRPPQFLIGDQKTN